MSYIDLAATLVKRLEGCKLVGYADSGGVATDGYGNTRGARVGVTITQEIADHDLTTNLLDADTACRNRATPAAWNALHDHQRAALVSFTFNLGSGPDAKHGGPWTIWRDINAGNLPDVPTQMRRFDKVREDGVLKVVPGLDRRREAEVTFWNTADVEAAATAAGDVATLPSSSVTREADTPPTPVPAPPHDQASVVTKIVTALAGASAAAGSAGQQIHDLAAPHVSEAPVFATIATVAAGVVVAAGILAIVIHANQAQSRAV